MVTVVPISMCPLETIHKKKVITIGLLGANSTCERSQSKSNQNTVFSSYVRHWDTGNGKGGQSAGGRKEAKGNEGIWK